MTLDELYRLLRTDHVQVQGIVDTLQEPLVVLDKALNVINANPAFFQKFRTDRDDTLGHSLFDLGNGQWNIPDLRELLAGVVPKAAAVIGYEVTHNFPDLGSRTMLVSARPLAHPDNNSTQLLVVFDDVTEQNRLDAAKDLLAAEARHRMVNLIAVLKAIVRRTQVEGRTGEEYRDAVLGRIEAVLAAQEFVSDSNANPELASLVSQSLEGTAGSRAIIVPGPQVHLASFQILPATMILHELVTNAFKYGALSNETGVIRVSWQTELQDGRMHLLLDWKEEKGPAVAKPSRRGFGTHLIDVSARAEGGCAVIDFDPAGLHAQIALPVRV
jgi:two-component sensor histidine kinase